MSDYNEHDKVNRKYIEDMKSSYPQYSASMETDRIINVVYDNMNVHAYIVHRNTAQCSHHLYEPIHPTPGAVETQCAEMADAVATWYLKGYNKVIPDNHWCWGREGAGRMVTIKPSVADAAKAHAAAERLSPVSNVISKQEVFDQLTEDALCGKLKPAVAEAISKRNLSEALKRQEDTTPPLHKLKYNARIPLADRIKETFRDQSYRLIGEVQDQPTRFEAGMAWARIWHEVRCAPCEFAEVFVETLAEMSYPVSAPCLQPMVDTLHAPFSDWFATALERRKETFGKPAED